MEELSKLAKEKGFEPHTITTIWTFKHYTESKDRPFLNDACDCSLLNEIQKWLRDTHAIYNHVESVEMDEGYQFDWVIVSEERSSSLFHDTFEEALKEVVRESLLLI